MYEVVSIMEDGRLVVLNGATGQTRIKGTFITASITTAAPARRTDWKGVATELGATADVIAAHTATAEEGVTTLRLVAN